MILNAHIERTIGKLDRFNEPAVGRKAGKRKSRARKRITIVVVKFVAVAVAFGYHARFITALHGCCRLYNAGVRAEP